MKLCSVDREPVFVVDCIEPLARGQRANATMPVYQGYVEGLPRCLDGVLVASDLQAREPTEANRAIGVVMAERISSWIGELKLKPNKIGVLLAGDFYTSRTLHRRFGVGAVDDVWDAFDVRFRWVTGVLGNVDRLGRKARKRYTLLEGKTVERDELRVGGISGIIGPAKMENRRSEAEFIADVSKVLGRNPDIVVVHEGPSANPELPGTDSIRKAFKGYKGLVICGHNKWPHPVATLGPTTILNTDGRCILLTRAT